MNELQKGKCMGANEEKHDSLPSLGLADHNEQFFPTLYLLRLYLHNIWLECPFVGSPCIMFPLAIEFNQMLAFQQLCHLEK